MITLLYIIGAVIAFAVIMFFIPVLVAVYFGVRDIVRKLYGKVYGVSQSLSLRVDAFLTSVSRRL